MNRPHIPAHAHVVAALGGQAPRYPQQVPYYQEGHSAQINARRNPRSNFRDRSNRRKTTGFEEIRQEYYQIHHNKARAEPSDEVSAAVHHQVQSVDGPSEFFPKPSAFIKAPRRQVPPRRPMANQIESSELVGGDGFRNRGSKAADMFQRRREMTDQFILDQENAIPPPVAQPTMSQKKQTMLTQSSSLKKQQFSHPQKPQPRMQAHAPVQAKRAPPAQSRPHHQQQAQQHYQQQQYQQQYQQQPRQHRQPSAQGHTTVDSRRGRQPLIPTSPRFSLNSPWKDRSMQVGKRFHPNVVPYQDSYNTTPKGWGRAMTTFGEDNNIKHHYEYTDTSEKFQFAPAPRINKFGSGTRTQSTENYNSRPKSWCDMELTASHQVPPMRRAYPSAQRQHSESSADQFAGHSGWGFGESDEL